MGSRSLVFLFQAVAGVLLLGAETVSAAAVSGTLDGALSVDQTGSAGYTVPVEVPPGTAEMQPSLSLSYNSNGGNGLLGQGWTLQGLSTISRCPKTKAQDNVRGTINYDADDRFCLDGSRLIAVHGTYGSSGAEYRTELDSFAKVISMGTVEGGPQYWVVWTKSGQKMEYGRTTSSRVEATGQSAVRQWKLNRVEDTLGNYLTVTYIEAATDGFAYPSRIDYSGHQQGNVNQAPYASVRFSYEDRHDDIVLMHGGHRVSVDKRLTHAKTYIGETLVSDYRLSYSSTGLPYPSRIVGIQRCDGMGDCLPGADMTWNSLGTGTMSSAEQLRYIGQIDSFVVTGDFSGTGRERLWFTRAPSGYAGYEPLVGDYDGDGDSDIAWVKASSAGFYFYLNGSSRKVSSGYYDGYTPRTGDFNGDGRTDVIWTKKKRYSFGWWGFTYVSTNVYIKVALSNGSGIGAPIHMVRGFSGEPNSYETQVGDFNGDGLSDLVWSRAYNGGIQTYVSLGDGSGGLGAPTFTAVKATGDHTGYKAAVLDFNGDGLLDMVWTKSQNGGLRAYAAMGKGDGSFGSVQYSAPRTSGNYSGYESLIGDFNGDGLMDLAWATKSNSSRHVSVSFGDGTGFFQAAHDSSIGSLRSQREDILNVNHTQSPVAIDFDGDGVSEIFWRSWIRYRYTYTSTYQTPFSCPGVWISQYTCRAEFSFKRNTWAVHYATSTVPKGYGRIATIDTGNGTTFNMEYESLSASSVNIYTKDSDDDLCSLPCRDIQMPLQVVKEVIKDHGDDLTEQISYRYGGAKTDLNGRGFKGFRWMELTDVRTGIVSRTEYQQDFPYIGQVKSSSRYVDTSPQTLLHTEANTWASLSLNDGKTQFPYISSSAAATYEMEAGPGNSAVTTVTNASSYDSYGNPIEITVTTTGAGGTYRKVTTNTYTNTMVNWRLGRLACAQVRSETPTVAVTRTSGFAYSSVTGLLTKEVVEPSPGVISGCVSALSAAELKDISLITTYQHDAYGNRRQSTIRGGGITSRSSATVWGERASCGAVTANGRFPVSVSNALGHVAESWYSGAFGKLLQSRDANGLELRQEYDGFGRLIRVVHADGRQEVVQYRDCTDMGLSCPPQAVRAILTDRTGAASVISYVDRRGLVVRTETEGFDGTAVYQDTEYDAASQAVRKSRAYYAGEAAQWSQYTYDKLGRVKSETLPNGSVTTTNYDGLVGGWIQQRVSVQVSSTATARTTTREYDARGMTVRMIDPLGSETRFEYTEYGKQKKVTAANGSVTERSFDLRGRLLSETDPDRGMRTYRYNALDELVSKTNARGQTTTFVYDLLGRLVRRSEAEGTTVWVYDASSTGKGRLAQVSGPDGYLRTHAYDAYGRPLRETATIGRERFTTARTYDAAGRVATTTYPGSGLVVRHEYTATGYLEKVRKDASCGTVYWTAEKVDAEGRVEESLLGNGVGTTRVFDPLTGLVQSIQSGLGETSGVQDLGYVFDAYGNLTMREDFAQDVYESFTYDTLNRLTGSELKNAGTEALLANKNYRYDAVGNLINKSDVGAADYVYGAGDAGPHAVTSAGDYVYIYDASGNMVSGAGRTLTWTSFQKPRTIAKGSTVSTFEYGPDRGRVRQVKVKGAVTEILTYVGGLYERVEKTGSAMEHVHYVFAGGARVAIETASESAGSNVKLRYLHMDHLGSVDVVTNELGEVVERLSFGAFGERRVAQGTATWQDLALALSSAETRRGFTGHEQLDDFGLVHMNGRVYDPHLGRFLSADPFVQFALSSQGYNRYTYAGNNPLSYTDPSGYFIKSLFRKVARLVKKVFKSSVFRTVAAVAFAVYGGPAGAKLLGMAESAFVEGAIGGFGAGLISSGGDIKSAFVGGLSGGALGFVGGSELFELASSRAVAHGAVGGVSSELMGGKFGEGFLSAGFSSLAAPQIDKFNFDEKAARMITTAVVGGTASVLAGGKFANGAKTAAYLQLFVEIANFYAVYTGTTADWRPGKNYEKTKFKVVDERNGFYMQDFRDLPADANTVGRNLDIGDAFCVQGDACSRFLNEIPGINATSKFHDRIMSSAEYGAKYGAITGVQATLLDGQVFNFATMLPSAAIAYSAIAGENIRGWHRSALAWHHVRDK